LSLIIVILQFPLKIIAQQAWSTPGPVDILIGRPSIWTLAQAHYLLAQMHKDDRALRVKAMTEVDPNAINRQRIEVLQTLLGVTAEFDQTALIKNQILQQRYGTNNNRLQTVQFELDRRNNDLILADRELYYINVDLTRLQSATPKDDDAIKNKTAERDAKAVEKQAIVDRISGLNSELTRLQTENVNTNLPGLTGPFSGAQPTPSPLTNKLNNLINSDFLNKLYTDTANRSSALQASMQLDNYIQGQYELIAKQLTLLRDEVGPDQRVIFLELPSGIYSVPKRGDDYIAQVRWQVTRYCNGGDEDPEGSSATARSAPVLRGAASSLMPPPPGPTPTATPEPRDSYERNARQLADDLRLNAQPKPTPVPAPDENCWRDANPDKVRTVDIIPRQSALNVNSIHETSNGFALAARFLTVFGFGAKVDYQRQREVYDQFVYQDIFASGFGKGSNSFGWTFGALPGTKALAPGVRTTFAVVVIPASARKIQLVGRGYRFRRGEFQPAEGAAPNAIDTFEIDIPGKNTNAFFVDTADYASVQSGKRVSLVLGGPYFSPQIGVLINGVPLQRSVAIAPIDLAANTANSNTNNSGISGEYEYVNSRRLIASFSMPNDYEGTPVIALVTPDKTSIINRYDIDINHLNWAVDSLERHALLEPMFLLPVSIVKIEFVDRWTDAYGSYVQAVITGRGFRPQATISVNGRQIDGTRNVTLKDGITSVPGVLQRSTHEYDIVFPLPMAPSWDITIRQGTTQGQEEVSYSLNRPLAPQITYDILRYSPRQAKQPARIDLRLHGAGFQSITQVQRLKDGVLTEPWTCQPPGLAIPANTTPTRRRRRAPKPAAPEGVCTITSGGEALVTVRLPDGTSNESLVFLVTGDKGESAILNILPPAAPAITSIVNDVTKKAEGAPEGGYSVVIRGDNFEQVERVYFGNKPALIQQSAAGVITVQAPKGDEGAVRVLLETNTPYQNKFLSNSQDFADPANTRAIFAYVKPKS
jgi:hypothetical protein